MEIKIAYGKTGLNINLEDDWDITVVEPKYIDALTEPGRTISDSLKNPINSLPLKELVMPHYKIGIIFSDITRPMPRKIILQTIFDELDMLSPDNIILIIRPPKSSWVFPAAGTKSG